MRQQFKCNNQINNYSGLKNNFGPVMGLILIYYNGIKWESVDMNFSIVINRLD